MGWRELAAASGDDPVAPGRSWSGPFQVFQPESLEEIFALRRSVWRNEPDLVDADRLDPHATMLRDDHEGHGLHWVVTAHGSIVAAARLCLHENLGALDYPEGLLRRLADFPAPFAILNRLVVHPSMRRQGLSRALTDVRVATARARGVRSLIVEAGPNLISPFRARGFVELGVAPAEPWERVDFALMALDLYASAAGQAACEDALGVSR